MGSWMSFDEFLTDDLAADLRDLGTDGPRDYRAALLREECDSCEFRSAGTNVG